MSEPASSANPRARRARRAGLALIGLVAIGGAIGAVGVGARSPRVRAAVRAFGDPSLVREDDGGAPVEAPRDAPIREVDLGEIGNADEGAAPEDAGLKDLAGFVLPDLGMKVTPRTMRFIGSFTGDARGREAFSTRYRRAGRYRRILEQSLRDAELPEDLVWVAAIASGFEPQATSRKGATGLLQITPELGARYGLTTNDTLDERRSLTRGTAVGVTVLSDLFAAYGQWDLALGAFDVGRERVDEAIARLRERRGPRDAKKPVTLEDLAEARLVPKETASFVAQVQAFAIVAANRGRFGLDLLDPVAPFEIGEIAVPSGTPLRLVAKAASVPLSVVRDYNPALLDDRVPAEAGDALIALPAERLAATLAAFPALYAREVAIDAGPAASASASSTSRARAPVPAKSSAPEPPRGAPQAGEARVDAPTPGRLTLRSGVVIEERRGPPGAVAVGARVELGASRSGARSEPGSSFEVEPIASEPGALAGTVDRVARAVRGLVVDGGDAATAARAREGARRRQRLEHAPYGASWLEVGDRLFPKGHPLAGTVLVSPTLPLTSVAIADPTLSDEPRADLARVFAITVTIAGADLRASSALVDRSFAHVLDPAVDAAAPELAREDRVERTELVPATRVVVAWATPSSTEAERAALRLAILAVAHNEVGKIARALVADRHVASHVRGFLDVGDRTSVVALELVPTVPHDATEVIAELDAALAAFGDRGPTEAELIAAKAQHRARAMGEQMRAGTATGTRDRIAHLSALVDGIGEAELAGVVKRALGPSHRVVVVTRPRGG